MEVENRIIKKQNEIVLGTDVYCYSCKQLAALSNTIEIDGRHYCLRASTGCADKACRAAEVKG